MEGRIVVFGTIEIDSRFILLASGAAIITVMVALRIGYLIALRKSTHDQLVIQTRDTLTGLWNRQSFLQYLTDRINQHRTGDTFSVVIINVKRFRWVNDALGPDLGDLVIRIVAQYLRTWADEESIIARLNGDEFAVILNGDIEGSVQKSEQLIRYFEEQPIVLRGKYIHILPSAGIAAYPHHGRSAGELLGCADTALGSARHAYNGIAVFDTVMNEELHDQFQLATDMRFAIQNGELGLVYQPRIDLATGEIAAVEALLRWNHPQRGLLSPSHFIPIAEQTGSIVSIGLWVLETACAQAVEWDWSGKGKWRISINISAQQLLSPDFREQLDRILKRTGLRPDRLELELTESIFIEKPDKISAVLSEIKEQGVRIAIDDFGTGYSSLSYLKCYPADTLKIDKYFITEIASFSGQVITDTIIELARRLGLTVVAEGVERSEQLEYLMARGCDEVQGFLLCKPVSADECEHFMQNFRLDELTRMTSRLERVRNG